MKQLSNIRPDLKQIVSHCYSADLQWEPQTSHNLSPFIPIETKVLEVGTEITQVKLESCKLLHT